MAFYQIKPERARPAGWQILNLAGIPFYVEPSFLIFIAIIVISSIQSKVPVSQAGLLGFVIFFSLLLHEAGHAFMARLFGDRNVSVSLVMFGGNTMHSNTTRGRNLLITLAGPLASLAIVAIAWLLIFRLPEGMQSPALVFLITQFYFLNLIWAIFNLLPIYPLDGGQSLYFLLSYVISQHRALLIVAAISMVCCLAGIVLIIQHHHPILLIILVMLGLQNLQIIRALK